MLIQEREKLIFDREMVLGDVNTLLNEIVGRWGFGTDLFYKCISSSPVDVFSECSSFRNDIFIANEVFTYLKYIFEFVDLFSETTDTLVNKAGEAIDCTVIGGFAVGTDCPQGAATAGIKVASKTAYSIQKILIHIAEGALMGVNTAQQIFQPTYELQSDVNRELWSHVRGIDDSITSFQSLSMDIFNKTIEIEDLKYQIRANFATYQDDVRFIMDHLIGRESGDVLRRRHLVMESDRKFRDVLQYTYRMLMAFAHEYNLSQDVLDTYKDRLFQSVTLDDIRSFIELIDRYALEYCGSGD